MNTNKHFCKFDYTILVKSPLKNIKKKAIGFPDVFYAEINCLFYFLFSPGRSYLLLRQIRSGHFRIVCRGAGCFFRVLDFHLLRCIFHPLENHAFCIH